MPAHQYILSYRSEFFRKIFTSKSEQYLPGEKPTVVIENANPELFERLLTFIYTDTCDLLAIGKTFEWKRTGWEKESEELSDRSDFIEVGSPHKVSAFEVYSKRTGKKGVRKRDGEKEAVDETRSAGRWNPVKQLQELARKFGVKHLIKR